MTTAGKSAAVKERSHSDTDPAVELDEIDAEDASAGADAEAAPADPDLADEQAPPEDKGGVRRRVRLLVYGVLPALVLLLTVGTGYLKWFDGSTHAAQLAAVDARQAAIDGTIAMLSYRPDTVDRDLGAAGDRLTSGVQGLLRQAGARCRDPRVETAADRSAWQRFQPQRPFRRQLTTPWFWSSSIKPSPSATTRRATPLHGCASRSTMSAADG